MRSLASSGCSTALVTRLITPGVSPLAEKVTALRARIALW
jgi:hypothetical protein